MNNGLPIIADLIHVPDLTIRLNEIEQKACATIERRGRTFLATFIGTVLILTGVVAWVLPKGMDLVAVFIGLATASVSAEKMWSWIHEHSRVAGELAREQHRDGVMLELLAARIRPFTELTNDPSGWALTAARYLVQQDKPEKLREQMPTAEEMLCQYLVRRAARVEGSEVQEAVAQRVVADYLANQSRRGGRHD